MHAGRDTRGSWSIETRTAGRMRSLTILLVSTWSVERTCGVCSPIDWGNVGHSSRLRHEDLHSSVVTDYSLRDGTQCMEKGLKNLQAIARSSQRRHSSTELVDERGNDEHEGDSGLGLSDAEKEAGDARNSTTSPHVPRPLQPLPAPMQNRQNAPPYLPLYEPPPNVRNPRPTTYDQSRPHSAPLGPFRQCHLSGSQTQRGCISIQSMLLPTDPRRL